MRFRFSTKWLVCVLSVLFVQGCGPASRKFYPIGIYTVATEEAFRDARDGGFNTVHIYDTKPDVIAEAERMAGKFGLKLVCYPGNHPRRDGSFNSDRVDETLKQLKYSRSILAWYLYDEPGGRGLRPDLLHDFHLYVKERSARIATGFVVGSGERYRDYAGCSDIAMLDWYPIPLHRLDSIAYHIGKCREYLGRGQEMWMVLQALDWTVFSEKVRRKGTGRAPTLDELRLMTFLSVAEKIDGVFYWSYRTPRDEWIIKGHPRLWEDVRRMASELNGFYPFLISRKEIDGLKVVVSSDVSSPAVKCLFKRVGRSELRRARRVQRGKAGSVIEAGCYLLAVNASEEDIEVEYSGFGSVDGTVMELIEGKILEVSANRLRDVLSPYQVRMYYFGR